MAARGRERRRRGAGLVHVALDALDARLGDPALVVVRERRAILDALRVEQPEQQLAEPGLLRPPEEARDLLVVDVGVVQRDAARALGMLDRHRQRDDVPHEWPTIATSVTPSLSSTCPHQLRLRGRASSRPRAGSSSRSP